MDRYIALLAGLILVGGAEAVIVAGGDGAQNTNAPAGGQGWDYVGRIDKPGVYSSVTYVSNNWCVTAYHIKQLDNPVAVLLGGASYPIDPNSWKRLTNSVGGNADLAMFRVVGGVGLAGLKVRSAATLPGSSLTMIGNGRNRQPAETHWSALWAEVVPPPPSPYSGYKWAAGATKRWGTNTKDANVGLVDDGFGITDMFSSDFDDAGGSEAQGALYDSGGGVFYNNGGNWELAGIMLLVLGYVNQPGEASVYGNLTYMADLGFYAAQMAVVAQIDDIDGDGIPDAWEYANSGSTTGVLASLDQDGDGFTGEQEWVADTVPTNGDSYPAISGLSTAGSLVFASSTNREYQIEHRFDLGDSNEVWQVEVPWGAPATTQTVHAVSTAGSNQFHRIRVRLP